MHPFHGCRLFGKPQLAMLFGDYLGSDIRGVSAQAPTLPWGLAAVLVGGGLRCSQATLAPCRPQGPNPRCAQPSPALRLPLPTQVVHFSPPEDPRINVTAKLGVPRPLHSPVASAAGSTAAGGSLTLRYQPDPASPYTFFDVKARARGAASSAAVRGCLFDPQTNLAVWAELPVAATSGGGGMAAAAPGGAAAGLRLGAKYVTPQFSAGAVVHPAQSVLSHAFVVRLLLSGGLLPWVGWASGEASILPCATRVPLYLHPLTPMPP